MGSVLGIGPSVQFDGQDKRRAIYTLSNQYDFPPLDKGTTDGLEEFLGNKVASEVLKKENEKEMNSQKENNRGKLEEERSREEERLKRLEEDEKILQEKEEALKKRIQEIKDKSKKEKQKPIETATEVKEEQKNEVFDEDIDLANEERKRRHEEKVKNEAERERLRREMEKRNNDYELIKRELDERMRARLLIIQKSQINLLGISAALNDLRQFPKKWANIIEFKYFNRVDDITKQHSITGDTYYEGRRVFKEAIQFLRKQVALSELFVSDGLTIKAYKTSRQQAENDWVNDNIKQVDQYATKKELISSELGGSPRGDDKLLSYFPDLEVKKQLENEEMRELETLVVNLIVDDGVQDRHHRKQIFNPMFTQVGIGLYKYKTKETEREKFKITLEFATSRYQTLAENIQPKDRKESGLEMFHQLWKQSPLESSNVDFMVAFTIPVDHLKMRKDNKSPNILDSSI